MKKSLLTLALALTMLLAFAIPIQAVFDSSLIQLNKSEVRPYEVFTVTVTDVTAQMLADGAFVIIVPAGSEHTVYGNWRSVSQEGTNVLEFNASTETGDYEARFYNNGGSGFSAAQLEAALLASGPLNVTNNPASAPDPEPSSVPQPDPTPDPVPDPTPQPGSTPESPAQNSGSEAPPPASGGSGDGSSRENAIRITEFNTIIEGTFPNGESAWYVFTAPFSEETRGHYFTYYFLRLEEDAKFDFRSYDMYDNKRGSAPPNQMYVDFSTGAGDTIHIEIEPRGDNTDRGYKFMFLEPSILLNADPTHLSYTFTEKDLEAAGSTVFTGNISAGEILFHTYDTPEGRVYYIGMDESAGGAQVYVVGFSSLNNDPNYLRFGAGRDFDTIMVVPKSTGGRYNIELKWSEEGVDNSPLAVVSRAGGGIGWGLAGLFCAIFLWYFYRPLIKNKYGFDPLGFPFYVAAGIVVPILAITVVTVGMVRGATVLSAILDNAGAFALTVPCLVWRFLLTLKRSGNIVLSIVTAVGVFVMVLLLSLVVVGLIWLLFVMVVLIAISLMSKGGGGNFYRDNEWSSEAKGYVKK